MALFKGDRYDQPAVTPVGAGAITVYGEAAVTTALADNDIVGVGYLPAGARILDVKIVSDDLDSGTALVLDAGLVNADEDDLATVLISGSAIGQAGGIDLMDVTAAVATAIQADAPDDDQLVGIKVTTVAGTPVAGAIGLIFTYVANCG